MQTKKAKCSCATLEHSATVCRRLCYLLYYLSFVGFMPASCYLPANAVLSPLEDFTSVFEMGTGVAPPPLTPA